MIWVRIGPFTGFAHDPCQVVVTKEGILLQRRAEDSDRLPKRDTKEIGLMETTDGSCYWVQNRIAGTLELANAEISWALVKTETNVYRLDSALEIAAMQGFRFNKSMTGVIEREVVADEGKGLSSPDASVGS
jgi:hypothetical protein